MRYNPWLLCQVHKRVLAHKRAYKLYVERFCSSNQNYICSYVKRTIPVRILRQVKQRMSQEGKYCYNNVCVQKTSKHLVMFTGYSVFLLIVQMPPFFLNSLSESISEPNPSVLIYSRVWSASALTLHSNAPDHPQYYF